MGKRCAVGLAMLFLACGGSSLHAMPDKDRCFSMSVWKNNAEVPMPDRITVHDSRNHIPVPRENGKYCLPNSWPDDQKLDVEIRIGDDLLYLPSISIEILDAPWRISYGKDVNKQIPRHTRQRIKAACMVEVDRGEPGIGMLINPCVFPAKKHNHTSGNITN